MTIGTVALATVVFETFEVTVLLLTPLANESNTVALVKFTVGESVELELVTFKAGKDPPVVVLTGNAELFKFEL